MCSLWFVLVDGIFAAAALCRRQAMRREQRGERNTCVAAVRGVRGVRLSRTRREGGRREGAPVSPGFLSVANLRSECEHRRQYQVGEKEIAINKRTQRNNKCDLGMTSRRCTSLGATREHSAAR